MRDSQEVERSKSRSGPVSHEEGHSAFDVEGKPSRVRKSWELPPCPSHHSRDIPLWDLADYGIVSINVACGKDGIAGSCSRSIVDSIPNVGPITVQEGAVNFNVEDGHLHHISVGHRRVAAGFEHV